MMTEQQKWIEMGLECGFTHVVQLNASTIKLNDEVRAMCASNKCRMYNTNWSCPPGCGTLAALRKRISRYHEGILVQTVGELEDDLDGEGMMAAQDQHQRNFARLHALLLTCNPDLMAIGAGACTRCSRCSYPEAPCRFPNQMTSSMEAMGMLVLQICRDNGLQYYYGSHAIAYTSCFLIK